MLGFFRKKRYISADSLSALTWKRFKKNRLSFIALMFICVATLLAILGYLITPDKTPFANEQFLELGLKKPGFQVQILKVRRNEKEVKEGFFKKMIWGSRGNYTKVPFYHYRFEANTIVIEEYTGDKVGMDQITLINQTMGHALNLI